MNVSTYVFFLKFVTNLNDDVNMKMSRKKACNHV